MDISVITSRKLFFPTEVSEVLVPHFLCGRGSTDSIADCVPEVTPLPWGRRIWNPKLAVGDLLGLFGILMYSSLLGFEDS